MGTETGMRTGTKRTAGPKYVGWRFPGGVFRALLLFALALCCPSRAAAAVDASAWTWDVLVVPPDEGWASEPGLSIQKTLLWHQAEVSEEGDGILG
ncbi:MAG: hypothetical protein LBT15_01410, partial [Synergistaceae bacterium]|nr:hypothetical protein [Synergistaceae bacterium]